MEQLEGIEPYSVRLGRPTLEPVKLAAQNGTLGLNRTTADQVRSPIARNPLARV